MHQYSLCNLLDLDQCFNTAFGHGKYFICRRKSNVSFNGVHYSRAYKMLGKLILLATKQSRSLSEVNTHSA